MNEVRVVFSKWGGRRHWEFDAVRLGEDEHGVWIGAPAGTAMTRPGVEFTPHYNQVALVPGSGSFEATFNAPGAPCEIYVDITTRPTWVGSTLRMFDLDLDVIRGWTGRVWVDDEDEFADHRVLLGYPADVVAGALETCTEVRTAVEDGAAPYDPHTHRRWLGELDRVMMER